MCDVVTSDYKVTGYLTGYTTRKEKFMRKKSLMVFLVAAAFAGCLAGCGKSEPEPGSTTEKTI